MNESHQESHPKFWFLFLRIIHQQYDDWMKNSFSRFGHQEIRIKKPIIMISWKVSIKRKVETTLWSYGKKDKKLLLTDLLLNTLSMLLSFLIFDVYEFVVNL